MEYLLLMKKFLKVLSIIFFSTLVFFIIIEFLSRTLVFFSTNNKVIFEYGFNKTIYLKTKDLSKLDFILISETKRRNENEQKPLSLSDEKLTIWAFGGSTTEGNEPGCGHVTSSWVDELSKINKNILTKNFGIAGNKTDTALNILHEQTATSEFKHTVGFNVSIKKLKNFDLYDFEKGKPDIILWAGKYNEQTNYIGAMDNFNKRNTKNFLQILDFTFKLNSVFYFLFNDIVERINYKFFKYDPSAHINIYQDPGKVNQEENLEKSKKIYKDNTIKAIKFAQYFNIDFHIISLFGRYDYSSHTFYTVPFYKYWFEAAEEISKDHNVYFYRTEQKALNILKNNKSEQFFCNNDNLHQTLKGNILTASIINDYLMKVHEFN